VSAQAAEATKMLEEARALEAAGCFALVLEMVPAPVAAEITRQLSIPVIGIGAGVGTSGRT
jgi:3-methyl-2-oxobutanoate hydroxymethyltransferase